MRKTGLKRLSIIPEDTADLKATINQSNSREDSLQSKLIGSEYRNNNQSSYNEQSFRIELISLKENSKVF
jgi:hypothetical protein